MEINSPTFFLEIQESNFTFSVGDNSEQDNFKIIYKNVVPIQGIENFKINNIDFVFNDIKKNIFLMEQKLNFTFKHMILIINNFDCSFLNLSGFKKLNGSQILKENITYILNSLKSNINEIEEKKKIIHIFNTKYNLDNKKIENLPIGLFGDFYAHELSFCLINKNDYMNINNIFNRCNLKIKKIFLKSFVEGACISNENAIDTFFQIKINKNNSQIFYFENDSLKLEQNFNFGTDLVLTDISKITSLKKDIVEKIIKDNILIKDTSSEELIEKKYFENENFRKIKKKLLFEIAEARIEEISQIILTKNINFLNYIKKNKVIFLKIINESHYKCFKNLYRNFFSQNKLTVKFMKNTSTEDLIFNVDKLVQYGWKKEAIPIVHYKKSLIARFFNSLFN
jgi:cell division protein FtsA